MNLIAFAAVLVRYFRALNNAERPIDRKVNRAAFDAVCEAANALGYGMTPSHIYMLTKAAVEGAGERPAVNVTGSNNAVRDYDAAVAASLAALMRTYT